MDIELCIYYNIVTIWFLFIMQSINLPPSAHTITSSAHCSTLQPSAAYSQASSAHTTAAIASSVHTLQQPLHLQCTYYSSHCIFSAHTTAAITSSVHTLQQPLHLQCTLQPCTAMYSYLQPIFSVPCSQLQPSTTTYTTAIPFSAHCSYTI